MIDLATARRVLELTLAEYSAIRSRFHSEVYYAIEEYLNGEKRITSFENRMRIAITESYNDTAAVAWTDGGGEFPLDDDAKTLLNSLIAEELSHSATLFQRLKMARKEGGVIAEIEAQVRADGYASTLDSGYANIKAMAYGNKMLTFVGEDGEESCKDCAKYKGKRHRAKWWVSHNAVPPSRDFECKGYRCQHVLVDDDGYLFTI